MRFNERYSTFFITNWTVTFASGFFFFWSAKQRTEVQNSSFVTGSFNIVAVCASPFSETEYEDKLACDSLFDCDRTGDD